jgi:hypothetical protein
MRFLSRIRMSVGAASLVALAVTAADVPAWVHWSVMGLFVAAVALYLRAGTPSGPIVSISAPVRGPWTALNRPTSRVPSRRIHAWSQTYAVDLVCDPGGGARPGWSWWPPARRPAEFPGSGSRCWLR